MPLISCSLSTRSPSQSSLNTPSKHDVKLLLELWIEIYMLLPLQDAKQFSMCCKSVFHWTREESMWERRFNNDVFKIDLMNLSTVPTELLTSDRVAWDNSDLRAKFNTILKFESSQQTCKTRVMNFKSLTLLTTTKDQILKPGLNWFQIDCFSKHVEKCTFVKSWKAFYKSAYFDVIKLKTYAETSPDMWIGQFCLLRDIVNDGKQFQVLNTDLWLDFFGILESKNTDQNEEIITRKSRKIGNYRKVVINLYMSSTCLVTLILPYVDKFEEFGSC